MESLSLDFLNSEWRDWRGDGRSQDRLAVPGWLGQLLARWGLELEVGAGEPDLQELIRLRSLMQAAVESIAAGHGLAPEVLGGLNRVLTQAKVVRRIVESPPAVELVTEPVRRDWPWVQSEIATAFVQMLQTGEWRRVKICENPACRWVFYDESRNRVRRWCDDKACGNLLKVRRFRERRKGGTG